MEPNYRGCIAKRFSSITSRIFKCILATIVDTEAIETKNRIYSPWIKASDSNIINSNESNFKPFPPKSVKAFKMTIPNPKRGRPKGTGLDDRHHLIAIATLIFEAEDLKPTTAIKSLGITDPSTIRRLRDKYNSSRGELIKELKKIKATASIDLSNNDNEPQKPIRISSTKANTTMTTAELSAATCALNTPNDPKLTDSRKKKKAKKTKPKSNSKKATAKTRAVKTPQKKTTKPSTKGPVKADASQESVDIAAVPMSLFNTWLSFNAEVMASTARTQLHFYELANSTPWFREAQQVQQHLIDTWLCTLSPQVAFDTNAKTKQI